MGKVNMAQALMRADVQTVDPAIFDQAFFRRYTMDNRDLEVEIIGLFRRQLPALIKQMRRAIDPYDWKLASHTLKGSARAVGATRLGEIAVELEELIEANASAREPKLNELETCVSDFETVAVRLYA